LRVENQPEEVISSKQESKNGAVKKETKELEEFPWNPQRLLQSS
jgi:hypothetical protein